MKMQLTAKLIDNIKSLRDGGQIPASQLTYSWVKEFVEQKILLKIPHKTTHAYKISNKEAFLRALGDLNPVLKDIDFAEFLLDNPDSLTRAEMVGAFGNSKTFKHRTAYGFMVNSLEPISAVLNGEQITINPPLGSYMFIADIENFDVCADVIIVGIENMENFYQIRKQKTFLLKYISQIIGNIENHKILFVSRYPQNTSLREWLKNRTNKYIHFGDYDLYGIKIFLTEFQKYLPERAYFLIPNNIESYIEKYGSKNLYDKHYEKCRTLTSDIPSIGDLINLIHKARKGLEQELFIEITQLS